MGPHPRSAETNDIDLFLKANDHFHMQVAEMSRLSFIGNLLEPLWMHIGPSIRQSLPNDALLQSAARHHREIYDAIVAKDPSKAVAAINAISSMASHSNTSGKNYRTSSVRAIGRPWKRPMPGIEHTASLPPAATLSPFPWFRCPRPAFIN
ncbi:MAG: FCD domain-containing protein [Zoogloea sp.]|nr:FCD domain-containing protein [Zoogloea sp.]